MSKEPDESIDGSKESDLERREMRMPRSNSLAYQREIPTDVLFSVILTISIRRAEFRDLNLIPQL